MIVIGAPNSSNSLRLAEVSERMGVPSRLIERAADLDWEWLGEPRTLGITAGASAPEVSVRELLDALRTRFAVTEEVADHSPERMTFKLPARACRLTELPLVEIFTDGACRGNPGPGGWAALLRTGEKEREIAGGEPLTTNNRMELRSPSQP